MTALFRYEDHTIFDPYHFTALTTHEAMFLGFLAKVKPRVVSFDAMCEELWLLDADQPDDFRNAISVIVHKLRPKLQPFGVSIVNVWGRGYYLVGDITADWSRVDGFV